MPWLPNNFAPQSRMTGNRATLSQNKKEACRKIGVSNHVSYYVKLCCNMRNGTSQHCAKNYFFKRSPTVTICIYCTNTNNTYSLLRDTAMTCTVCLAQPASRQQSSVCLLRCADSLYPSLNPPATTTRFCFHITASVTALLACQTICVLLSPYCCAIYFRPKVSIPVP